MPTDNIIAELHFLPLLRKHKVLLAAVKADKILFNRYLTVSLPGFLMEKADLAFGESANDWMISAMQRRAVWK